MRRIPCSKCFLFAGGAILVVGLVLAVYTLDSVPRTDWPRRTRVTCVNNLKQIGLALKTWALDHEDKYPFNCSTNEGGTLEFCERGSDGFDNSAAIHFQVMSNEIFNPRVLLCPQDRSRRAATDFFSLRAGNITYRMRSGTNLTDATPQAVLVTCPVDGNTVLCDGSVKGTAAGAAADSIILNIVDLLKYKPELFWRGLTALVAISAGSVLLLTGLRRRTPALKL